MTLMLGTLLLSRWVTQSASIEIRTEAFKSHLIRADSFTETTSLDAVGYVFKALARDDFSFFLDLFPFICVQPSLEKKRIFEFLRNH